MRKLRVLLAVLALVGAVIPLALTAAAPVMAACTRGTVEFDENTNGSGESITYCVGAQGAGINFDNVGHPGPGICEAPVKLQDDWNDCISSINVSFYTGGSAAYCMIGYDGLYVTQIFMLWEIQNAGWNNLGANDKLTSVKFGRMSGGENGGFCDVIP